MTISQLRVQQISISQALDIMQTTKMNLKKLLGQQVIKHTELSSVLVFLKFVPSVRFNSNLIALSCCLARFRNVECLKVFCLQFLVLLFLFFILLLLIVKLKISIEWILKFSRNFWPTKNRPFTDTPTILN